MSTTTSVAVRLASSLATPAALLESAWRKQKSALSHLEKASELGQIQVEYVETDYTNGAVGDLKELYDKADPTTPREA